MNCSKRVSAIQISWNTQVCLDILRAAFIRCSFISDGFEDNGPGLSSSPTCPLIASFNTWSRFSRFFLYTLINLSICGVVNNSSCQSYVNCLYTRSEVSRKTVARRVREEEIWLYGKIFQVIKQITNISAWPKGPLVHPPAQIQSLAPFVYQSRPWGMGTA